MIGLGPHDRRDLARRAARTLVLAMVVVAVEVAYLFFVTAGTMRSWPTYNANYDLQAEGFRSGHLYLSAAPSPDLLAQDNPFDPKHRPLWAWDLTLYKGHYYMYWGPFPALILAAVKGMLSLHSTIGDQYLVYAFYSIYLVSGALLIDRMARRLFPAVRLPLVVLGILVFAFSNPSPFLLATAGIYQAAIIGGQAFLVAGMVFAFDAVWAASVRAARVRTLLAAGACWAAAIACRVSTGPPVLLLTILTVVMLHRGSGRRWFTMARDFAWLAGPVALGVFALLLYNKLRFESWFEFGTNYQLSTMQFRTSRSYLAANLYSYLLRPMISSCHFPFVTAPWNIGAVAFPPGFKIEDGYWVQEPVAGMILAVPWCWLVPIGIVVWLRGAWRAFRSRRDPMAKGVPNGSLWCGAVFGIIGTTTMLPIAGLFIATMRYLADINSGIVLFAIWTAYWLYMRARRVGWGLRAVTVAAIGGLAIATIALGSLLGFEGYDGQFRVNNPKLHDGIVRALSRCESP